MIYGKLQALSMTAGTLEENAKLLPCVLQWLKVDEARSNTARLGDLTRAIQTSQVRRRIRTSSPGQDCPSLDQSVSGLDLNAAVGLTSYSNDDLWRTHGPQTLRDACSFVRRVVKFMAEEMITEGKAVQQILMKTAREDLRQKGIVEFERSDSETMNPNLRVRGMPGQRKGNAVILRNLRLMP